MTQTFADRMIGAARLDVTTYEEVEADRSATGQALGVVVLASIASGIGGLLMGLGSLSLLIQLVLGALLGWALWAFLVWLVGTKLLPEPGTRADWGEVARTTGFAQSPGMLMILGFVPVVGWLVMLVVSVWLIVTMVVAVRQALDYTETWRAVVVVVIGAVCNFALRWLLGGLGGF